MVALGFIAHLLVFSLPQRAQVSTLSSNVVSPQLACYNNPKPIAIDKDGRLSVLVWNIHKQSHAQWQAELTALSQDKQLLLLQEASMTPQLRRWIDQGKWSGNLVDAFKAFDTSAGVLNLAHQLPKKACAHTEMKP